MLSRQCPFCEHTNPPEARFCNACGVKLHAALCPHCGAVNLVAATICVQCAQSLESATGSPSAAQGEAAIPASGAAHTLSVHAPAKLAAPPASAAADAELPVAFWVHFDQDHKAKIDRYDLDAVRLSLSTDVAAGPSLPALASTASTPPKTELNGWTAHDSELIARSLASIQAPQSKPSAASEPARPLRYATTVATVVLVMLAGLTYFLYREHSKVNLAPLVYASGQPSPPAGSSDDSTAIRRAMGKADDALSVPAREVNESAAVVHTRAQAAVSPPSPQAPAAPARATIDPPTPMRPQIGAKEAAAAVAAAAARPKPGMASSAQQPQRFEPCTEAIAALGLCTPPSTASQQATK